MPFTGAFEFVLCPSCKYGVHPSKANAAPPGAVAPHKVPKGVPPSEALEMLKRLDEPEPHWVRRLARAGTTAGVGITVFLLCANLVALVVGVPVVLAYAAENSDPIVSIFLLFPFPTLLFAFGGMAAAAWFLLLAAVIGGSAFLFLRAHVPGAWRLFLRVFDGEGAPPLSEPNGLFTMARLFSVSIAVAIGVAALASAVGATPTVPAVFESEPFGVSLILLAHASVWEELVTRVLLLGVPLLLIHLVGRGRLETPARRYFLGGGFVLDGPALAFVVFQAAVFGAAHVPGWDLWKFPSTFVTGLVLGVLFLRFGLAACFLLHFLNDYLAATVVFSAETAFPVMVLAGFYILMAVGIANAGRYVFVLIECVRAGRVPEYLGGPAPRAAAAAPMPHVTVMIAPAPAAPAAEKGAEPPGQPPGSS